MARENSESLFTKILNRTGLSYTSNPDKITIEEPVRGRGVRDKFSTKPDFGVQLDSGEYVSVEVTSGYPGSAHKKGQAAVARKSGEHYAQLDYKDLKKLKKENRPGLLRKLLKAMLLGEKLLQKVLQLLPSTRMLEFSERLGFNLPNTLTGNTKLLTHLF